MGKITLVLGGARSGKSTYALNLAGKFKRVAFVATCQSPDEEMQERIKLHRKSRPKNWVTFEEPKDLGILLKEISNNFDCVIVDCLTLWASNMILARGKEKEILRKFKKILAGLRKVKFKTIVISNEVGMGIVPVHKLGRDFRDIAGRLNQMAAEEADDVFFMFSGIASKIK